MSELIIGLTLVAGYLLNKDSKPQKRTKQYNSDLIQVDKPNGDNIYSSNKVEEINQKILEMSTENYEKAKRPAETGVLPPLYNSYSIVGHKNGSDTIGSTSKIRQMYEDAKLQDPKKTMASVIESRPMFNATIDGVGTERSYTTTPTQITIDNEDVEKSLLTGLPIQRTHENMVPFFGGSVKQNMEEFSNESLLDKHSGNVSTYFKKKEIGPLFQNERENIYGAPVFTTQVDTDRYIPSVYRQNEKVIEDIKVSALKSGTYENNIRPVFKTVDELRATSMQKQTYEGRVVSGQKGEVRGVQSKLFKRRPETFIELNEGHLLRTTGKDIKNKMNQDFSTNFKNTSRQDTNIEYYGAAGNSEGLKDRQRLGLIDNSSQLDDIVDSIVQHPRTNNFDNDYLRNATGAPSAVDYGKSAISLHETERTTTGVETHVSNPTRVEYGNKSRFGDAAKPTMKETMLSFDNTGNMKTSFDKGKSASYNENITSIEMKPTQKQSTILNNYKGNMNKSDGMGYLVNKYQARETHKEDTIVKDRAPGPQSFKVFSSKNTVGEIKSTCNLLLKESEDTRLKLNVLNTSLIPTKDSIGYVQKFRHDNDIEDTVAIDRVQPDLVQIQHNNNPFSIYNKTLQSNK